MDSEHFALSLSKRELQEVYRALFAQACVEDLLRNEQGLESVPERGLLARIEALLALSPKERHGEMRATDESLWQYAWYVVTDEWAWFRALQEERRELGERFDSMSKTDLQKRVERRYQKEFDRYIRELEMKES